MGAKLAHPDRQVVVAVGDGDFGMMTQELETSVRENIPVMVLAQAHGANGERIENPAGLNPALERALNAGITTVLDLHTEPWQSHHRAEEFKKFHMV